VKTFLAVVGVVLLLLIAAGFGYVYSGAYDIAADAPDNPVVAAVVATTRRNSLRAHVQGIQPAANLDSPERIQAGLASYHDDCEACHGYPDHNPGPIGKGLNPSPPKLWRASGRGPAPGTVYWVVMHGIKMTGMPSWDHEYSDDDAWSVVAFVRTMSTLSGDDYRRKVQALPASQEAKSKEEAATEQPADKQEAATGKSERKQEAATEPRARK
jgi:mono/diheme cytochrome c family protein